MKYRVKLCKKSRGCVVNAESANLALWAAEDAGYLPAQWHVGASEMKNDGYTDYTSRDGQEIVTVTPKGGAR